MNEGDNLSALHGGVLSEALDIISRGRGSGLLGGVSGWRLDGLLRRLTDEVHGSHPVNLPRSGEREQRRLISPSRLEHLRGILCRVQQVRSLAGLLTRPESLEIEFHTLSRRGGLFDRADDEGCVPSLFDRGDVLSSLGGDIQ